MDYTLDQKIGQVTAVCLGSLMDTKPRTVICYGPDSGLMATLLIVATTGLRHGGTRLGVKKWGVKVALM